MELVRQSVSQSVSQLLSLFSYLLSYLTIENRSCLSTSVRDEHVSSSRNLVFG